MEHFLTFETFTLGVSNYLKANLYQNSEKEDLWKALTNASHNKVMMMDR
jgi:aminopeptidase N